MPKFTFDMRLAAAITVDAPDAETAKAWLMETLECADTNFGAYPNGDPILGEVSLNGAGNVVLAMIDDEDVPTERPADPSEPGAEHAMFELLCENAIAWEGEEESVREEHEDLIAKTDAFIDANRARFFGTVQA